MRDFSNLSDSELDQLIAQQQPTDGGDNFFNTPAQMDELTQNILNGPGGGDEAAAFLKAVPHGVYEAAQGPYQIGAEAVQNLGLDNGFNSGDVYTKVTDAKRKAYDASLDPQTKIASDVGDFVGNVAPYLASPGGATIAGALQGGTSYVPEGGSRVLNTALGAGIGKGMEYGGKLLGKTYNAIAGGTEDPAAKAIIDAGDKYNVPVFAADASQNPLIKGATEKLEDVPFLGTKGERLDQMQKAQTAAESVVDDAKQQMLNTNIGTQGLQKIADSNDPVRSSAAKSLLNDVAGAGDDWNKIVQNSGNLKLYKAKLTADQKYGDVEKLASQFGDVDTKGISSTVRKLISDEKDSVLPNESLINTLNKIDTGLLERSPAQKASTILDSSGQPVVPGVASEVRQKPLNYTDVRKFRSDLSNEISDYYNGKNALIGQKGVQALQEVKNQVDNTLNKFAQDNGPELKAAWQDADTFYKTNVIPYKDPQLAKALSGDSPDEIYSKFITRGEVEGDKGVGRATKFYNALDDQGRAAVRYGIVKDAFEKAVDRDAGSFSPAKFASALDRTTAARGVFFKGAAKKEIEGFKNLMRGVQRSKVATAKPETGVKAIPWIAGLLGVGAHAAGASGADLGMSAAGVYGVKKLLTTDTGRRILLASSKLQADSPAMQRLIDSAGKVINRSAVKESMNFGDNGEAAPDNQFKELSDEQLNKKIAEEEKKSAPQTPVAPPKSIAAPTRPQAQSGVTPQFLNKVAMVESGGNPNAHSPNSTASGLYQFTNPTWKAAVDKYGQQTGITYRDKNNPRAQSIMAALTLRDNAQQLNSYLGRAPQQGEIYLTHFLGIDGAKTLLASNPNQFAAQVLPAAARANRSVFFRNGRPVTVAQLYGNLNRKVSSVRV